VVKIDELLKMEKKTVTVLVTLSLNLKAESKYFLSSEKIPTILKRSDSYMYKKSPSIKRNNVATPAGEIS
jgi:hypothetical protein